MVSILLDYSNLTPSKLNELKDTYMSTMEKLNNKTCETPNAELTWDNIFGDSIKFNDTFVEKAFFNMKDFHMDETIRELCSDLSSEMTKFDIEQSMRKDVYEKFKFWYEYIYKVERISYDESCLEERTAIIEDANRNYKMMGLDLEDDKYNRVKEIKKELTELCNDFSLNLSNENAKFEFTKEELVGLPEDFIEKRLVKNEANLGVDNKVMVTLKYPDVIPIMDYCKNRDTRKKISIEFKRRCINENTELSEKAFKLRKELATIFGFENYSDYRLQNKMAKTTETVNTFLTDLVEKMKPKLKDDLKSLLELAGNDAIDKLEAYDIAYYSRIYTDSKSGLSKEDLKKYFPVEKVVSGTLEIYQKLLGLKFQEVSNMKSTFWHDSVKLYEVKNKQNDEVKGYFYLDLFPRDGKYGHAACFNFIDKSEHTLPVAAMACNFPKDYLYFDDVETFFHEFGHVMHHISSRSKYSDTSSFSCEMDFVETPSQMFEEWCYQTEPLKMMSEGLTNEMIEQINKKRNMLSGWHYSRQLTFSITDMEIHSNSFICDAKKVYDKNVKEICQMDLLENTNEMASFGHLMGGYESGYYGYLWSLVYAKDLFSMFKGKELDEELGMKLREEVLSYGSIRDSSVSIRKFLGREPSSEYFFMSLLE
jgi:Zn-dependent oligopeptidase